MVDQPGWFLDFPVIEGAREGVCALAEHADVWICSKPLDNNPECATEKKLWLKRHIPEFKDRLILAPDKSLIRGDILLDDAPKLKWFARAEWLPVVYNQPFNQHPGSELFDLPHYSWDGDIKQLVEYAEYSRLERMK